MSPPISGQPLLLYHTSTKNSVGALLAQEHQGIEKSVYYLSHMIIGPEERYSAIERHCLALVFVAQKLRHYLLDFPIHIITRSDPIKYLLERTVLMGRATRWFLILSEYDLQCATPRSIKSQALADLLANFPSGKYEPPLDVLPGDDLRACVCTSGLWTLSFDGSSVTRNGGARIVLTNGAERHCLSYNLDFLCSNNEAEYEALTLGLLEALRLGVQHLRIAGDSNLILKQVTGDYALKHAHLAIYRATIQALLKQFLSVKIEKLSRVNNHDPDALATIATKTSIPEGTASASLIVQRRTTPTSVSQAVIPSIDNDWRKDIKNQLQNLESSRHLSILKKIHVNPINIVLQVQYWSFSALLRASRSHNSAPPGPLGGLWIIRHSAI